MTKMNSPQRCGTSSQLTAMSPIKFGDRAMARKGTPLSPPLRKKSPGSTPLQAPSGTPSSRMPVQTASDFM